MAKSAFIGESSHKNRFSDEHIIGFSEDAKAGTPVKELCRKHGFSDVSTYTWRKKSSGMNISDALRLRALEEENAKLLKLLAETMLDNEALQADRRKNTNPRKIGALL